MDIRYEVYKFVGRLKAMGINTDKLTIGLDREDYHKVCQSILGQDQIHGIAFHLPISDGEIILTYRGSQLDQEMVLKKLRVK